jgi:hypothetical protein
MSKATPKQPVSFRIRPDLFAKFKSYCERYDLNQTEVIETLIERLETDTEPEELKPVSLPGILRRVEALEAKVNQSVPEKADRTG